MIDTYMRQYKYSQIQIRYGGFRSQWEKRGNLRLMNQHLVHKLKFTLCDLDDFLDQPSPNLVLDSLDPVGEEDIYRQPTMILFLLFRCVYSQSTCLSLSLSLSVLGRGQV